MPAIVARRRPSTSRLRSSLDDVSRSRRDSRSAHAGIPVVVRCGIGGGVKAALARPGRVCARQGRAAALARSRGDDLRLARSSRRTRSAPATSRRGSGASRCSRSSSRSAGRARGPSRTSARSRRSRTPTRATARTVSRFSATGSPADEVVARLTEADEGRASASSASSTAGGAPPRTPATAARVGRSAHRPPLRGAGEHPRLRRDGRCAGRDVRDERRRAARRTAPRLSRRRAGGRRRQPRPAVGGDPRRRAERGLRGALRRLRRSPRRRPRAAARRAAPSVRHPSGALRPDAALASGSRSTTGSGRRSPTGWPCSATRRLEDWAGVENLEERVDGEDASTRSCSGVLPRALELAAAVARKAPARRELPERRHGS